MLHANKIMLSRDRRNRSHLGSNTCRPDQDSQMDTPECTSMSYKQVPDVQVAACCCLAISLTANEGTSDQPLLSIAETGWLPSWFFLLNKL